MSEIKVPKQGGTSCCVPLCNNNTKYSRDVSWHIFPKDLDLRKEWIRRIRRQGHKGKFSKWIPSTSQKICGAHFNKSGKKKYEEKLPCFFPNKVYSNKHLHTRETPIRRRPVKEAYQQMIYLVQFDQIDDASPSFRSQPGSDIDLSLACDMTGFEVGANVTIEHASRRSTIRPISQCVEPRVCEGVSGDQSKDTNFHSYTLTEESNLTAIYKLKKNLHEVISASDALKTENIILKREIKKLKEKWMVAETQLSLEKSKQLPVAQFPLASIINDDKKILFYRSCRLLVSMVICGKHQHFGLVRNMKVGVPSSLDPALRVAAPSDIGNQHRLGKHHSTSKGDQENHPRCTLTVPRGEKHGFYLINVIISWLQRTKHDALLGIKQARIVNQSGHWDRAFWKLSAVKMKCFFQTKASHNRNINHLSIVLIRHSHPITSRAV